MRNRERWIDTLEDQETGSYREVVDNDEIAVSLFIFFVFEILDWECVSLNELKKKGAV